MPTDQAVHPPRDPRSGHLLIHDGLLPQFSIATPMPDAANSRTGRGCDPAGTLAFRCVIFAITGLRLVFFDIGAYSEHRKRMHCHG